MTSVSAAGYRGPHRSAATDERLGTPHLLILQVPQMTKADLVEQIADAIGPGVTKKDCALVVDGLLNAVKQALEEGESIEIRGFGTFKLRRRKARTARNPRTGEAVDVPARDVPVFKPSRSFRDQVEGREG